MRSKVSKKETMATIQKKLPSVIVKREKKKKKKKKKINEPYQRPWQKNKGIFSTRLRQEKEPELNSYHHASFALNTLDYAISIGDIL